MQYSEYISWVLLFLELLSGIVGFVYFYKIKNTFWKWFPIYLSLIFLTELFALYIKYIVKDYQIGSNLYRYWGIPIQFLFFYWFYFKESQKWSTNKTNLVCVWGAVLYVCSWFADIFYFYNYNYWFSSFSYTIGNIVLVVIILKYFIDFIECEEIIDYKIRGMFWVSVGLLIFYLGTLPFYGLRNSLYYQYNEIFWMYDKIQLVLDCVMYVFFIIAFIWTKPK